MILPTIVMILSLTIVLHRIEEGHVGVYFRAGALLPLISKPGIHLLTPFLTSYRSIQVTLRKICENVGQIQFAFIALYEIGNTSDR